MLKEYVSEYIIPVMYILLYIDALGYGMRDTMNTVRWVESSAVYSICVQSNISRRHLRVRVRRIL